MRRSERKIYIWEEMFSDLVGDLPGFLYRLQSRLSAITLIPEEYPNDLSDHLPNNSANLLVATTAYEGWAIDPKKVRNQEYIGFDFARAKILRSDSDKNKLHSWEKGYEEQKNKIKKAVEDTLRDRKFYLKIPKREIKKMRENIHEHGVGFYFRERPFGIGLKVCLEGEPIRGINDFGGPAEIKLSWPRLFPNGTPEYLYFSKVSFWNSFWSHQLIELIDQGVAIDPLATWRSCQRQIRHHKKVIEDTIVLGKEYDDEDDG